MRNRLISKMGVAAAALMMVGVASAQTNGPSGISARLGAVWPNVGDSVFAAGLDYKLASAPTAPARGSYLTYVGFSLDYYSRNSDNYNVPVAVTYNIRNNQFVLSAGIGVDFSNADGDGKTGLGGQLAATYEFGSNEGVTPNPLFVQAKYFFANEPDLSGFGLYLGYRF